MIKMMRQFLKESVVDGFEFVVLPEWDREGAPLTMSSGPIDCEKHSVAEITETLLAEGFPILSVHANRDIGNYLCSEKPEEVSKGIRLADDCLALAKNMNSGICVFHLWDTFKEDVDLPRLKGVCKKLQEGCPEVSMSIENVPTKCGKTPFRLVQDFDHKTLDLKWASMYDEFGAFTSVIREVNNVHIQGRLADENMVPSIGNLNYEKALTWISDHSYGLIFTVELEGWATYEEVTSYLKKLKQLVG